MVRCTVWIPVFQLLWLVTGGGTERSGGESPRRVGGEHPRDVTFDAGDTAVLYCSVTDLGDLTVTWRKLPNRNPLTIGTRTWVKDSRIHAEHVPNSTQWNLVIQNVNATDAGTYECQVSKRGRPFRHRVNLAVKKAPTKRYPRIEISGRNFLKQGEKIHLECNATMVDVSIDNLEWLKDGRPILQQPRMRIMTSVSLAPSMSGTISSTLEITDARVDDSGVYVCRSTERSQLAGVKLEVKPGASNSKRAENIQQYTGSATGGSRSYRQQVLTLTVTIFTLLSLYISSIR